MPIQKVARTIQPTLAITLVPEVLSPNISKALLSMRSEELIVTRVSNNQRPALSPTNAHTQAAITEMASPTEKRTPANGRSTSERRATKTTDRSGAKPIPMKSKAVMMYRPIGFARRRLGDSMASGVIVSAQRQLTGRGDFIQPSPHELI
jgi:hypothetical protein